MSRQAATKFRSGMKYGKIAVFVAIMMAMMTSLSPVAALAEADAPYVSLGADLTAEQRGVILDLLDLTEAELTEDTTVIVTNEDEHRYFDGILSAEQIGSRALSCCKVVRKNEGYGIKVETHNVTSISAEMLQCALATAGMKNAYVVVAAPVPISGTAALIGAMQAYAKMNGHALQTELILSAGAELITADRLAAVKGDPEKVIRLLAAAKQIVVSNEIETEDELRAAIRDIADRMSVSLNEEELEAVIGLMKTVAGLDLDPEELSEQIRSIYDAVLKTGVDLSSYGLTEEKAKSFFERLPDLLREILDWIRGIFGAESVS